MQTVDDAAAFSGRLVPVLSGRASAIPKSGDGQARTESGVTLTALANAMNLTPTNPSRLERGLEHNTERTQQAFGLLQDI